MQPGAFFFRVFPSSSVRTGLLITATAGFMTFGSAQAMVRVPGYTDGTWINTSGGTISWSYNSGENSTKNWAGGKIASGAGATADFSTIDIVKDTTISLTEGGITVANLIFGDKDPATAAGWLVSGSTLTLSPVPGSISVPTITVNALGKGESATINSTVAGTNGLNKEGMGTLTLGGIIGNTYTGNTTVNAGTLALDKTKGAAAIVGTSITINSGGTLLLQAPDQIAKTTNLNLNGGTFSTGTGFSESLGTLTLTSDSVISLGASLHNLTFGASSSALWSPTATLTIYGWSATGGIGGTFGSIFFGANAEALTSDQLRQIKFDGYSGATLLSTGELVPMAVPEAQTYLAALLLGGLVLWREKSRRFLLRHPHVIPA